MNHKKSIKSAVSGLTYNSNEIRQNLSIDEQIQNHKQILEHLQRLKEAGGEKLISQIQDKYP